MKTLMNLKTLLTSIFICFAYFAMAQSTTSYGSGASTQSCCSAYFGNSAGQNNTSYSNTMIGYKTGQNSAAGQGNVYIGSLTAQHATGSRNTYIGTGAGPVSSGSGNVFIGYNARLSGDNKLAIDNSGTTTPLIYGDFASDQIGINTNSVPAGYTLAVKGKTITEEVKVRTYGNWPDYVFAADYNLSPLSTLENDIKALGHLPGVPSAEEVEKDGFNLGEMDAILLEKVEELTLYLIQVNKKVEQLETENETLKAALTQTKK